MQVVACTLVPGISITLLEDAAGWRFSSWSEQIGSGKTLPQPPAEALALRFATQDDAVRFFAQLADAH